MLQADTCFCIYLIFLIGIMMGFYVVVLGLFLSLASYGASADTDAVDSRSLNPLVPSATVGQENLLELLTARVGSLCSLETSFDFLKAALTHHLGHDYSVFGTEAVLREWSSNLTSWCEHLAGIISRDYVAFDPQNWDPAGAKGKHVVVDRGVLDNRAHVGTLDEFFREAENQTQSLIVNVLGATTLTMGQDNIPKSVHNLMVTNTDGSVTKVGDYFLRYCIELRKVDLNLPNVTAIRNAFLWECSGLTAVDLNLPNLTTIGHHFLAGCEALTALDLSALSKVTTIGGFFLRDCGGLKVLDLTALSKVTTIENDFLWNCGGLKVLDLSALSNVTTIEDSFLDGCSGLKALDLRALSKVTRVGQHFLENCNLLPGHVTYPDGWTHPRPY